MMPYTEAQLDAMEGHPHLEAAYFTHVSLMARHRAAVLRDKIAKGFVANDEAQTLLFEELVVNAAKQLADWALERAARSAP